MDAKEKIVRWECRPLNWEVQYQQRDDGEWVKFTDHEAALAELASERDTWETASGAWQEIAERYKARNTTLLTGLEALAGEWDVVGSDVWANELRERIRTLASAGLEGKPDGND